MTEQLHPGAEITLPLGAELNYGPCEDSDSVVTNSPTRILVVGELKEGSLPVRIMGEDGQPTDEPFYLHRPR
jgi:hypothetical protein